MPDTQIAHVIRCNANTEAVVIGTKFYTHTILSQLASTHYGRQGQMDGLGKPQDYEQYFQTCRWYIVSAPLFHEEETVCPTQL